jgi:hypothetical protein
MANPISGIDEAGDAVRGAIRAYHGSPYDFDKFSARRIGTGEGAQAFGHGMYFAGNEGTAKYYRDLLGSHDPIIDQKIAELNDLHGQGFDPKIRDAMENLRYEIMDLRDAARQRPGRMYEVEIGHPQHSLLELDGPMGTETASRLTPPMRASLERGLQERLNMGQLKRHAGNILAMQADPSLAPGGVLYEGLAADYGPVSASRKLLDAGIPGIRYLDQGSRSAGQGTRNYVMFPGTEDAIRILRKYGLMAPIAAGAMQEER